MKISSYSSDGSLALLSTLNSTNILRFPNHNLALCAANDNNRRSGDQNLSQALRNSSSLAISNFLDDRYCAYLTQNNSVEIYDALKDRIIEKITTFSAVKSRNTSFNLAISQNFVYLIENGQNSIQIASRKNVSDIKRISVPHIINSIFVRSKGTDERSIDNIFLTSNQIHCYEYDGNEMQPSNLVFGSSKTNIDQIKFVKSKLRKKNDFLISLSHSNLEVQLFRLCNNQSIQTTATLSLDAKCSHINASIMSINSDVEALGESSGSKIQEILLLSFTSRIGDCYLKEIDCETLRVRREAKLSLKQSTIDGNRKMFQIASFFKSIPLINNAAEETMQISFIYKIGSGLKKSQNFDITESMDENCESTSKKQKVANISYFVEEQTGGNSQTIGRMKNNPNFNNKIVQTADSRINVRIDEKFHTFRPQSKTPKIDIDFLKIKDLLKDTDEELDESESGIEGNQDFINEVNSKLTFKSLLLSLEKQDHHAAWQILNCLPDDPHIISKIIEQIATNNVLSNRKILLISLLNVLTSREFEQRTGSVKIMHWMRILLSTQQDLFKNCIEVKLMIEKYRLTMQMYQKNRSTISSLSQLLRTKIQGFNQDSQLVEETNKKIDKNEMIEYVDKTIYF
ncbi:MAG: hypothetical protein MHMPM18_001633 [Marteilia pararefringens]